MPQNIGFLCLPGSLVLVSHGFVMIITEAHANKRATPNLARHVRIEYYFKYLKKIKEYTLMKIYKFHSRQVFFQSVKNAIFSPKIQSRPKN